MKKYFCDVCGKEIVGKPEFAPELGNKAVEICKLEDLCPRCSTLSLKLDVSALVLAELKRQAGEKPARSEPHPAPARALKGKGAKEKREIQAAIEKYRQEHGPGSVNTLARKAKVSEADLRDMLMCGQVAMGTWRAVGKALGVKPGEFKIMEDTR